jgi:thiamine-phosphate pyrophosphorylase
VNARPLPNPPVQLITGAWSDVADLRSRVEAALRGGIRWVQLRAKTRPAREICDAAMLLSPMLREAGCLLVINDRVDVAIATRAGGVHLPEDGMPATNARRLLGESAWIARSLHSIGSIRRLRDQDLDAVQFGPIFDTASKREFGPAKGLEDLARAAEMIRNGTEHLVAVGGICGDRAAACREAGADAVSVIAAIWDSEDVEDAARTFVRRMADPLQSPA